MFKETSDSNIEMWKLRKLQQTLNSTKGRGTSMISLVISPREKIFRVSKMLADEYAKASNIKSRVNRLSVLNAITSVRSTLRKFTEIPPNGLIIYCGTTNNEDGKEKILNKILIPHRLINMSLFKCQSKFDTSIITTLLADDNKTGFIIMDGNGALFGTLQGKTREVLYKFTVDLPKKHSHGGQSAVRFSRVRMEKRYIYVKKVAEAANQVFINADRPNVTGLVLAGSADFKNELSQCDNLDQRLKSKIIKIVDVSYGDERGFNEAIDLAAETLHKIRLLEEKKLLGRFFKELSHDTGKCFFGVEDTFRALELGAVETLICWEDIDLQRYELKSNVTDKNTIVHLTRKQAKDKSHFTDKESGVELELVECQPLLEWLTDHYKTFGATLEIITDKSKEGTRFVQGFGGLGGLLRYKVDFQSEFTKEEVNVN